MNHQQYNVKEIRVSSLIKQVTQTDPLFKGHYLLDPYQNCSFGCLYCDSCEEDTIYIKYNALDALKEEMENLPRKLVIIGSAHDPYQPIEKNTQLTRSIIIQLLDHGFPIHILTKSTLVLRDKDLFLSKSNDVFITFSVVSSDQSLVSRIEPYSPTFQQRLITMNTLSTLKIKTGIALIPILPCLVNNQLSSIIKQAATYQAHYFLFQHLFLKGNQKTRFISYIINQHPSCLPIYEELFNDSIYPSSSFQEKINSLIKRICGRYHLPTSLPI
jgi:DNA repair photolyase